MEGLEICQKLLHTRQALSGEEFREPGEAFGKDVHIARC
jgi:hypothetical protein